MQVEDLINAIRQFRDDRDWRRFHNPKELSAALAIEASELQEMFFWKTSDEIEQVLTSKHTEVADLAIYLFAFADHVGIDLAAAKYPIDKVRGSSAKYTEL